MVKIGRSGRTRGRFVNDFDKIGHSGKFGHFDEIDEIVIEFKFKLIENESVVLSWVYLQPFCSTTKNTSVNDFVNKPSKPLQISQYALVKL